jgi:hypothetical protein
MARTSKRKDDLEELNEEALRMQEQDTVETTSFSLEDDDTEIMELGSSSRRGFSRLNDEEIFRYRDF